MLHRIGHKKDVYSCGSTFPRRALQEVYTGLMILDEEYGYDRNWKLEGGYSILAETAEDVAAIKQYVDFDKHPPEWVTSINYTKIISGLIIMNNDFSIMVYMPQEIAPQTLLDELED